MLKYIINVLLITSLLIFETLNVDLVQRENTIGEPSKTLQIDKDSFSTKGKSIQSKWLPEMVKVDHNLYIDKGEITNFNWLEYLSWLEKIYGKDAAEYKNALPQNKTWSQLDDRYAALDSTYLYLQEYREHPVVGISYQQAIDFSQWRADRVMQYYLIKKKIIAYHNVKHQDSIFTIEKYFRGEYLDYSPNKSIYFYPEYTLPDSVSYFKYSHFADSLNTLNYKSCKKRHLSDNMLIECNCYNNYSDDQDDSPPYGWVPTKSNDVSSCRKEIVAHLKGNVREMTLEKGVFYGLSFISPCNSDYNKLRTDTNLVNCYTGFRNVCRYRDWRE